MSQVIHCVRHPAPGGGGQTVNVPAYRVFAVLLGRFDDIDERHDVMFQAASDRLRDILTEIAEPAGRRSPRAIDLVWASVAELSGRRPNERVVYFVPSFREGIIHPYAAHMATRASEEPDRLYFANLERQYLARSNHAGLTLEDRQTGVTRMLSEVHINRVMAFYPNINNAGEGAARQREHWVEAGRGLGGMAFHELMHNVIDLNESRSFDLHNQGGIAAVDGFGSAPQSANLQRFARHMLSPTPAQIIPTGRRPSIPIPRPQGAERAPSQPDLSGDLDGL